MTMIAEQEPRAGGNALPADGGAAIVRTVDSAQRRLWLTAGMERLSLAIGWAGLVGIFAVTASLIRGGYFAAACVVAAVPLVFAVVLVRYAHLLRRVPVRLTTEARYWIAGATALCVVGDEIYLWIPATMRWSMWAIPAAIAGLFVIMSAVTVRRPTAARAAIFLDQQAQLKERISTAHEIIVDGTLAKAASAGAGGAGRSLEAAFISPILASASQACASLRTAKIRYGRLDRRMYGAAACAAFAAASLCLLTPLPAPMTLVGKRSALVVQQQKKLAALFKEVAEQEKEQNPVAAKKLQALKEALTDLRKGNMSPFDTDARLAQEKRKLQEEQQKAEAADNIARAMENIKGMEDVNKAADALKDAAGKSSQSGSDAAKAAMDQARSDMQKAADAAGQKMGGGGGMSQDDRQKLAQSLKAAAAAGGAGGDPGVKQHLDAAADAAGKGDGASFSKEMAAAGDKLSQERAEGQLSESAVKSAMESIDRAGSSGMSAGEAAAQGGNGSQGGSQGGGENSQQGSGGGQNGQSGGGQNGGQQGSQGGGMQQQSGGGSQGNQGQNSGQSGGQSGQSGQSAGAQAGGGSSGGKGGGGGPESEGGSTNMHQAGGPGSHDQSGRVGGTSDFVKVYDQKSIDSKGRMEKTSGKINPLGTASGTAKVMGEADKGDVTIQTYDSQLPAARKRALDDLQTQQIPPQYRDLIRSYYDK